MRVVHLSLLHSQLDARIFRKECITLAEAGYDVHLVASGPRRAPYDGVTFHSVSAIPDNVGLGGRLVYHLRGAWRALRIARRLRAPLYHLHEVPLIPVGLYLRLRGAQLIYDVHEDAFREKISNGRTLGHPWAGWIYAFVSVFLETLARCCFQGFVAATPQIGKKFPARRTTVVQNFPRLDIAANADATIDVSSSDQRENVVVYIGNLFANRGAADMVDAIGLLPDDLAPRLLIAGQFAPASLKESLEQRRGWQRVEFVGWLEAADVTTAMAQARVGLVVLHPVPNYLDSYPVKMFEYMAAGLPVVASDFPLWRTIIDDNGCGVLVNPLAPHEIAAAIEQLLRNPRQAASMGQRGRDAVHDTYHWQPEAKKLLEFYRRFNPDNDDATPQ